MIKPFFIGVLLLVSGVVAAGVHYMTSPRQEIPSMISAATGMVSPSLSVAYYEPRILLLEKASNPAYPAMPSINRLDYVYAK
jgi:hypothetical protein